MNNSGIESAKRILIFGSPGAGKTTLSEKLGKMLGLPVKHLDKYFWKNWKECPDDQWDKIILGFAGEDKWIIDGNYFRTIDMRLERADTVIFLDYKRSLCLWSVLKRVIKYHGKQRFDMGDGCPERIDLSFMKWVYQFPKVHKPRLLSRVNEYPNINKIVLKSRKEADIFLSNIKQNQNV